MPDHKPLTPEWLHELVQINFGSNATPQQVVDYLDRRKKWPEEFLGQVTYLGKLNKIRDLFRRIVDKDGHRLYHNIPHLSESGALQPMYVNEELFDPAMYEAAIYAYYEGAAQHHFHANHLRTTCYLRYGILHKTYEEWRGLQDDDPQL